MFIIKYIQQGTTEALKALYSKNFTEKDFQINQTKPEFEGDYTVVLFALTKLLKQKPEEIGKTLGDYLVQQHQYLFTQYNVIKGFLNLTIKDAYWLTVLNDYQNIQYGFKSANGQKVMVEYSSPNTNKPLHLGHLRNIFLGWSVAEILKANGYDVVKTCVVNDRGIHICKSMLAWQKFANGATPQLTNKKGDHFVGDYYVQFEQELRTQAEPLIEQVIQGTFENIVTEDAEKLNTLYQLLLKATEMEDKEKIYTLKEDIKEIVRNNTPIMQEVKDMLRKWEAGDQAVLALWKQMNTWVYEGFDMTYKRIGSDFQKIYYESDTYLLGKKYVEEGLQKNIFYKKEDGSVWIDLTQEGLDQKLVLRKDGTSVYITQDVGLAKLKYDDYKMNQSIYIIADEQNYHMQVLKLICKKLGLPNADGIQHLSYGMVELPTGRMKSREGTVVDADDIIEEMIQIATKKTKEQGKTEGETEKVLKRLYITIGLGALKFFLLRVDPKKRMVFNPEESIDLHGYTATFIQYAYARIQSILRKEKNISSEKLNTNEPLLPLEKKWLIVLEEYSQRIETAAKTLDPSHISSYAYHLAKIFNTFYAEHSVLNAETENKKIIRLQAAMLTAHVLKSAMGLLGIEMPERM